jgi:exopolysaccharide biosynthesis polyprenyl glycosylphosphotransferase
MKHVGDLRAPLRVGTRRGERWAECLLWVLGDGLALGLAWRWAGYVNQFYSPLPPQLDWGMVLGLPGIFWGFAFAVWVMFLSGQLYSPVQARDYLRSGRLVSVVYVLGLVAQYFYDPKLALPRSLVWSAWVGSVVGVMVFRVVSNGILAQTRKRRSPIEVYVIASASRLPKLGRSLALQRRYRVVGAALSSMAASRAVTSAIVRSGAQEVLAEGLPQTELASQLYWQLRKSGITLRLIPSSVETLHRRGIPEIFAGMPTLRLEPPLLSGWDYRVKRGIDLVGSGVGLVVLMPLLVGIAIAIQLDSPGGVFFRQARVGLNGSAFRIWKFRTMRVNAPNLQSQLETQNESRDGIMFKVKSDPRVTKFGLMLRRSSLDELPQLLNVWLGQMSLVGPRPLPLRDVERFEEWHHVRHQVLPGMTGLWQISGRSEIDEFDDAARLDLYYIDHWSLNLDVEILMQTIAIVLRGRGAF